MNWYIAKLEIKGMLKTPLVSDTLWGHIAWSIALEEGEEALQKFIDEYEEQPPILCSHAFPEGFLPMPRLTEALPEHDDIQFKKLAKISYIPAELFSEPLSWNTIIQSIKRHKAFSVTMSTHLRVRNAINRVTSTVQEGALWAERGYIWKKKELEGDDDNGESVERFDLYCLSSWDAEKVFITLSKALLLGYGGKTSIGYGNVRLVSVIPYVPLASGNRMMALGCVAAKPSQLPRLLSNFTVRHGKLGPIMAYSLKNPYKKPIAMFDTGSTCDPLSKPYAGTVVRNVHTDPRIVSMGAAPLLLFNEKTGG